VNDAGAVLANYPGVLVAQAGGPLPVPSTKAAGVEMYARGESATFDKLNQDIDNLGIKYVIEAGGKPRSSNRASYDPETNTLRISRESYDNYRNTIQKSELRRDIVHELEHARQHKTLLQNVRDPQTRKQLLAKEALSMSENEYVKFRWSREVQAERTAWQVHNESLDFFEKSRHREGFSTDFLQGVTKTRVEEFTDQTQAEYERDFRASYKRIQTESRSSK
jgi:hypothetical protein